jgi:hypothetical protein
MEAKCLEGFFSKETTCANSFSFDPVCLLNFNLQQVAAKKRSTDKTDRLARKAT